MVVNKFILERQKSSSSGFSMMSPKSTKNIGDVEKIFIQNLAEF
jgi:hypothetical protein